MSYLFGKWDVFHGENEGLIVAEIEPTGRFNCYLDLPEWIGEEMTNDPRYLNCNLIHVLIQSGNNKKEHQLIWRCSFPTLSGFLFPRIQLVF